MKIFLSIIFLTAFAFNASAYFENHPPYKSKEKPFKSLNVPLLVDYDHPEYKSIDGKIVIRLKETADTLDFFIKVGGLILVKMTERESPVPYAVYQSDLDKNGLMDFIVFYNFRANGLAAYESMTDLFLNMGGKGYRKISFKSMNVGLEDYVNLNNDDKNEVIITDTFCGEEHCYFSYSIYEFKDGRLVNADAKFKGFPKFIWMTNKPNDKDTVHLTAQERASQVVKKNEAIQYSEIK